MYSKKLLSLLIILFSTFVSFSQDLIITGVYDADLTGGTPKGVELYASSYIADLSDYGLGSANNGGGTDGEEFTFPSVSVNAGTYIYVASESTQFNNWFGFTPDYTDGSMGINGDDAIELFYNGAVADVYGDIDTDGTGEAWEYTDGWAYRNDNTGPDGSTFSSGSWTFAEDAYDGETTNAGATPSMPVGTYTTPCVDTEDPTMVCQDITVELDASGEVTITPSQIDNGSFDDCGIVLLTTTTDFDCDDLGANSVSLFGFDAANNIGICAATVTVVDNISPSIAGMPSSQTLNVVSGTCGAVATWTEPTASDNCSVATFTSSHDSGDTFPLGETTVTYTATDDTPQANVTTATFTVTVTDNESPSVTGSITASTVEGCDASAAPAAETTVAGLEALTGDLAIADACTADGSLVVASSDASAGTCPVVVTRTYTVTDASDNTSVNIVHTINVDDTTAPVVSGSITASTVEGCDANDAPAAETTVAGLEALTGDLAIADACTADGSLVVASSDASAGTCPLVITRTYTVTDACDNTSVNIVHTINVDDTTAPVVSGSITASTVEGCDANDAPAAETTVAGLEALTGDLAIADACTADGSLVCSK